MGTELMSGPFRYIVFVAQLFKKTEQDMATLENILTSLHKEISSRCVKKRNGESIAEEGPLYETDLSGKVKIRSPKVAAIRVNSSNRIQSKCQTKSKSQTKNQTISNISSNFSSMNLDEHPHWFVRVIEFYVSVSNAFGDLRKDLKASCKEYARAMITYVRFYKQNAEVVSENWEKYIDIAINSLRQNYDKKIEGLTSMMRVCEQQRVAISENKTKLLSEIEITTVEIICIKETTLKLLPTITMQEELLESTSQKIQEIEKMRQKNEDNYTAIKKAKCKLIKHHGRVAASRNSFLREVKKIRGRLVKSIASAQREAEKIKLRESSEKEDITFYLSNNKTLKNKVLSVKKQKRDADKLFQKIVDEICQLNRDVISLEEKERRILFSLQTACVSSHKQRNDLKKMLAATIQKLQQVLYVSTLKRDEVVLPIEREFAAAKEHLEYTTKTLEELEGRYIQLCERFDEGVDARNTLKNILVNTESNLEELHMNLLMMQNGYKKFIQKNVSNDEPVVHAVQKISDVLSDTSLNETFEENTNELDELKRRIFNKQRTLRDLREKEKVLQNLVRKRKYKTQIIRENIIALAHTYISIIMLPASKSFPGDICHVSLLNDRKLGSSRMPDILMTAPCCSIDNSLPLVHADEQSSKCSSRSRKKSKTWVKFENTLRKNLVSELRRVMKIK